MQHTGTYNLVYIITVSVIDTQCHLQVCVCVRTCGRPLRMLPCTYVTHSTYDMPSNAGPSSASRL